MAGYVKAKDVASAKGNIGAYFEVGRTRVRWFEDAEGSGGFRFEGTADRVCRERDGRMDHTGWYLDDDGDDRELARGVVYSLPHRRGYIAGMADAFNANKDGRGPCILDTNHIYVDAVEAARAADRIAEVYAENERDYRRASAARMQYEDRGEEVSEARKSILEICADLRRVRSVMKPVEQRSIDDDQAMMRLCRLSRARVKELIGTIHKARKKRAELLANFGHDKGWQDA